MSDETPRPGPDADPESKSSERDSSNASRPPSVVEGGDVPSSAEPHEHPQKRKTIALILEAADEETRDLRDRVERVTQHIPAPVRRFLMSRVLLELTAIALLLLAAVSLFVRSDTFREWVRRSIEAEATLALRRPVRISDVRAEVLPPRVFLIGIEIANAPAARRAPFLEAEELALDFGWIPFDERGLKIASISLTHPRLRLERLAGGRWNVPDPVPSRETGGSGESIRLERLQVLGGILEVEGRELPLEGEALRLTGQWLATGPGDSRMLTIGIGQAKIRGLGGTLGASGRLAASISGERIRIDELAISSDAGQLRASGQVSRGAYRGRGKIAIEGLLRPGALDRFFALHLAAAGEANFAGSIDFERTGPRLRLSVTAKELTAKQAKIRNVNGKLDLGKESWSAELSPAQFGGGTIAGRADQDKENRVTLSLHGSKIDIAAIEEFLPSIEPRPSGRMSLDLEAKSLFGQWADIMGTFRGSVESVPGGAPVAGRFAGSIGAKNVRFDELALTLPFGKLDATGSISVGGGPASLAYSTEVDDTALAQRILWSWLDPPADFKQIFPAVAGRLVAHGRLETGGKDAFELVSDLRGSSVVAAERSLGEISGHLVVGPSGIAITGGSVRLDSGGSLALDGRIFGWDKVGALALDLRIDASRFPMETVFRVVPLPFLRVTGLASGQLELTGLVRHLEGGGPIELATANLWGQNIDSASGTFEMDGGDARFSDVMIRHRGGTMRGSATFFGDGKRFEFSADYERVPLSEAMIVGPLLPKGTGARLTGKAAGGEIYARPRIWMRGVASNVLLFSRELTPAEMPFSFEVADARMTVDWKGPGGFDAHVESPVAPAPPEAWGSWTFGITDLAPYAKYFGVGAHGTTLAGHLGMKGTLEIPLGDPPWRAPGSIDSLTWESAGRKLSLSRRADIVLNRQGARFDGIALDGSGGHASIDGRVLFGKEARVEARGMGSIDFETLRPFLPAGLRIDGSARFDLRAEGNLAAPVFTGSIEPSISRAVIPGLREPLDAISGHVDLRGERATTESIVARYGDGTLRLAGTAKVSALKPVDFRVRLEANRVTVRDFEGFDLAGGGELIASGTLERSVLRGELRLDRAIWKEDFRLRLDELLGRTPRPVAAAKGRPWMNRVELEVRLEAPGTLAVRNNLAKVSGNADLALRGTLGRPSLLGQVTLLEGGEVEFQDVKYEVSGGTIFFTDPFRVNPIFDISAQAEVKSYLIRLNLAGTLTHFTPTFTSDPPLPESNIIVLLLSGTTPDDEPIATGQALEERLTALTQKTITSLTLGEVNRRGRELLGLDLFSIDPLFSGTSIDNARVTAGKRLSKDLMVSYSYAPDVEKEQILTIEYKLGPRAYLVGTRDGNNVYAFDLKIRTRY